MNPRVAVQPASPRSSAKSDAESKSEGLRILLAALGLNPPKLAAKVRAVLKRKGATNLKVDRTTVYRILNGETKRPAAALRNALIAALQLEAGETAIVRRQLGGSGHDRGIWLPIVGAFRTFAA